MLSNYPDHEKYFEKSIQSINIFYTGKSKRKLVETKLEIHEPFESIENVNIDGTEYNIKTIYIAYRFYGELHSRGVAEGANVLQAFSMMINSIIYELKAYKEWKGISFYENDYNSGWNKRTISELFWYLERGED